MGKQDIYQSLAGKRESARWDAVLACPPRRRVARDVRRLWWVSSPFPGGCFSRNDRTGKKYLILSEDRLQRFSRTNKENSRGPRGTGRVALYSGARRAVRCL